MPSRTPYETWLQQEQRKRRRAREVAFSVILLLLLVFWAGVIWGLTVLF
jgi:predicted nucleic acid-binding Zn ribbon protein